MTSSLVGSEMCIRDSPKPCPAGPLLLGRLPRREGLVPSVVTTAAVLSVSYTHLTLPTICSV
eukprot:2025266-Prorocentrum_lima.AAC.1